MAKEEGAFDFADVVRAISDKSEFARYMGGTTYRFGGSLFAPGVIPDTANPTVNVAYLAFNTARAPWNDRRVRAAVSAAIGARNSPPSRHSSPAR